MKKYKNYIVLIILIAVTIIGCVYALKWHSVYKEDLLSTTIITDYIHELKKEEFLNYITENPHAIIYFGITSDNNCRRFEKEFKEFIVDKNLRDTVVYINVNELSGTDFGNRLDTIYNTNELRSQNKYFSIVPAVAVYNHTTLMDFVSGSNLKVAEVQSMLNKYSLNGE